MSDEWADSQIDVDGVKGCLRSFQNLKAKHAHLKVVLSVGGGGKGSDNFAGVAANHASRERFGHTARELVKEYGLDGIDSNTVPPLLLPPHPSPLLLPTTSDITPRKLTGAPAIN